MVTTEQAGALANSAMLHELIAKHGGKDYQGEIMITFGRLAAMLSDHRQQVIDQLADQPGAMPDVHAVGQAQMCYAQKVREAITILEAKYE